MSASSTTSSAPEDRPEGAAPEAPEAREPPPRAPLLWILLPLIGGYLGAREGWLPGHGPLWAGLGLALAAVTAGLLWRPRGWRLAAGSATAAGAAFLLAAGWFVWRSPTPLTEWRGLPPRALDLTVRLDWVSRDGRDGRLRGGATITAAPQLLPELAGRRAALSLWLAEGEAVPARGEVFPVHGKLTHVAGEPDGYLGALADGGLEFTLDPAWRTGPSVRPPPPEALLWRDAGHWLEAALRAPGGTSWHRIHASLLLGRKELLTAEERQTYAQAGAAHVFAVSGLHVAAAGGVLFLLLRPLPLPGALRAAVGLAGLWAFVEVTGAAPSAVRAWLMVAFVWAARAVTRRPAGWPALVGAALLVLVADPGALASASFQLSYVVVAGLILFGQLWAAGAAAVIRALPMPATLPRLGNQAREAAVWVAQAVAVSAAAALASAPLTILLFGQAAPGAVLANLWFVPSGSLLVLTGLLAVPAAVLAQAGWPGPAQALAELNGVLVWSLDALARASLEVPGATLARHWHAPELAWLWLLGLLATAAAPGRARWLMVVALAAAAVVGTC